MIHLYNTFHLIKNVEDEVRNAYSSLIGAEQCAKQVNYTLSSLPEIKDGCMELMTDIPSERKIDSITPPMVKVNILLDMAITSIRDNAISLLKKHKTKKLATDHKEVEHIEKIDELISLLEDLALKIEEEQRKVKEYRKANESLVS